MRYVENTCSAVMSVYSHKTAFPTGGVLTEALPMEEGQPAMFAPAISTSPSRQWAAVCVCRFENRCGNEDERSAVLTGGVMPERCDVDRFRQVVPVNFNMPSTCRRGGAGPGKVGEQGVSDRPTWRGKRSDGACRAGRRGDGGASHRSRVDAAMAAVVDSRQGGPVLWPKAGHRQWRFAAHGFGASVWPGGCRSCCGAYP